MIDKIRAELLRKFRGSDELVKVFLGAFFSRAKILEWGAQGKGKSLLAESMAKICGTTFSRIQGSQGLTESRFLARYDIAKLLKGEEKIVWRDFVKAKIKLWDEINRCHPTVLNSAFSMLAEGMVIFGDERLDVGKYVFIGTMNPADEGTYQLPPPFLDRFDVCIPLPSLTINQKLGMIGSQETELNKIITEKDLEKIWSDVEKIEIDNSAETVLITYVRDMQLCAHGEKEFLTNFPACCESCRFKETVCSKLDNRYPISERVILSAERVAKGIAFVDGRKKADTQDIMLALKYALFHRVKFVPIVEQTWHSRENAIKQLINTISAKDMERSQAYQLVNIILGGKKEELKELEQWAQNDLLLNEMYLSIKASIRKKTASVRKDIEKLSDAELSEIEKNMEDLPAEQRDYAAQVIAQRKKKASKALKCVLNQQQFNSFCQKLPGIDAELGEKIREFEGSLTTNKSEVFETGKIWIGVVKKERQEEETSTGKMRVVSYAYDITVECRTLEVALKMSDLIFKKLPKGGMIA